MSSILTTIKPVNRHLLIVPYFTEKKTNNGVLLPDDYKPEEDRYVTATVLDAAKDCSLEFKVLRKAPHQTSKEVVVERAMIESLTVKNKQYYLILENYIVGIVKDVNDWEED